jgi:hypothetical protein
MPAAPAKGKTVPVIADHEQTVEIHWRQADGSIWIERRDCPPPLPRNGQ